MNKAVPLKKVDNRFKPPPMKTKVLGKRVRSPSKEADPVPTKRYKNAHQGPDGARKLEGKGGLSPLRSFNDRCSFYLDT